MYCEVYIACIIWNNTSIAHNAWVERRLDLILAIDFESETPIYMQIRNQIVRGIGSGELSVGEKLPTIRALSDDLGINPMTVSKAYSLLKQEGFISADRRGGSVVSEKIPEGELDDDKKLALHTVASEARIRGMGEREFLKLCSDYYRRGI